MATPPDLVVPMRHHVPFLWRDAFTASEWFALDTVETVVRIRGVALGDMRLQVHSDGRDHGLSLAYEGRTWVGFTCTKPRDFGAHGPNAKTFDFLQVRPPSYLLRLPRVASERHPEYFAKNTVERPDLAAAAWATRRVERALIHDGSVVLKARYCSPHPLDIGEERSDLLRSKTCAVLECSGAMVAKGQLGPDLVESVAALKRTFLLAALGADPESERDTAFARVHDLAVHLAQNHPHATKREAMARLAEKVAGTAPSEDVDALGGLAP